MKAQKMQTLYNAQTKQGFIDRITNLTPQSKAAWGKMNAPQMMKHLRELVQLANGTKTLPSNKVLSFFLGRILKNRIVHPDKPLPKGLGNEKLPPNDGFTEERKRLIEILQPFEIKCLSQTPLPLFGRMNEEEWDRFLVKQFEHHLTQFGV